MCMSVCINKSWATLGFWCHQGIQVPEVCVGGFVRGISLYQITRMRLSAEVFYGRGPAVELMVVITYCMKGEMCFLDERPDCHGDGCGGATLQRGR